MRKFLILDGMVLYKESSKESIINNKWKVLRRWISGKSTCYMSIEILFQIPRTHVNPGSVAHVWNPGLLQWLSEQTVATTRGQGLIGLKDGQKTEHSCPIVHTAFILTLHPSNYVPYLHFLQNQCYYCFTVFLFSFFIFIPSIINTLVYVRLLLLIYSLLWQVHEEWLFCSWVFLYFHS